MTNSGDKVDCTHGSAAMLDSVRVEGADETVEGKEKRARVAKVPENYFVTALFHPWQDGRLT
jgi:hypothetical protein